MLKIFKSEKGFALISVFLLILIGGVLITSYVSSLMFNIRFSRDKLNKDKAYYAAQSGVQHLKADVNSFYNDNEIEEGDLLIDNEIISHGSENAFYSVHLSEIKGDTKIYASKGIYDNSESVILFEVKPKSITSDDTEGSDETEGMSGIGVLNAKKIDLRGSLTIDNGDIYSEEIKINGAFSKNYNSNIFTNEEDNYIYNHKINVDDFELDNYDTKFSFEIDDNKNIYVSDGENIFIDEIDLSGGKRELKIINNGEDISTVNIFVENGFSIGGNAKLIIGENLNVNLFIKESYNLNGNASINNERNNSTLINYIHPDIEDITLNSNISGNQMFYAPETSFKLDGGSHIIGAIVAEEIKGIGVFRIGFDPALEEAFNYLSNKDALGDSKFETVWIK